MTKLFKDILDLHMGLYIYRIFTPGGDLFMPSLAEIGETKNVTGCEFRFGVGAAWYHFSIGQNGEYDRGNIESLPIGKKIFDDALKLLEDYSNL